MTDDAITHALALALVELEDANGGELDADTAEKLSDYIARALLALGIDAEDFDEAYAAVSGE